MSRVSFSLFVMIFIVLGRYLCCHLRKDDYILTKGVRVSVCLKSAAATSAFIVGIVSQLSVQTHVTSVQKTPFRVCQTSGLFNG